MLVIVADKNLILMEEAYNDLHSRFRGLQSCPTRVVCTEAVNNSPSSDLSDLKKPLKWKDSEILVGQSSIPPFHRLNP